MVIENAYNHQVSKINISHALLPPPIGAAVVCERSM
jgi:hypothetical protein